MITGWLIPAAAVLFLFGIVALYRQLRDRDALRRRTRTEDALKHLFDQEYRGRRASFASLRGMLRLDDRRLIQLLDRMQQQGLVKASGQEFQLTGDGERVARQIVRAHRLLERYFADEARLPLRDVHAVAERREPDCTIVVADATALERNLNLALQVLEITDKAVLAVNLMDEAQRKGIAVDVRSLSRDLGVPAVPVVARTGEGLQALLASVAGVISGEITTKPGRSEGTAEFNAAIAELVPMIEAAAPGVPNARWIAIRLLDGDGRVERALRTGELAALVERQQRPDERFSRKIALQGAQ